MNYHPDDFLSLIVEAETQGGAHLNEVCKPTVFRMNLPIDDSNPSGPKQSKKLSTVGCRRRAKFLVPFLGDEYFDGRDLTNTQIVESVERDGTMTFRDAVDADFDFQDSDANLATMSDGTPMLAKVCAVDDAMGLWPRFQRSMTTGESFEE